MPLSGHSPVLERSMCNTSIDRTPRGGGPPVTAIFSVVLFTPKQESSCVSVGWEGGHLSGLPPVMSPEWWPEKMRLLRQNRLCIMVAAGGEAPRPVGLMPGYCDQGTSSLSGSISRSMSCSLVT